MIFESMWETSKLTYFGAFGGKSVYEARNKTLNKDIDCVMV